MTDRQKQIRKLWQRREKRRRSGNVGPARTSSLHPERQRSSPPTNLYRANRQLERMLQRGNPNFKINRRD